ncbi:nucleotide-binding oligomerization domain-containing protein 1-like [Xyrauchen texanus]|uniref:nucleotide-binding oligomerization domain-containing protein 1-like n=1 Tax=Xyrauchen texanus TaxID=154827 RepID=UPI002242066E|nr:nucleotide-binding oligomerization domain-containing protein 1-like [Xyrauchen texanus]
MGSCVKDGTHTCARASHLKLLTLHRELLVDQVKNTQCVLDNLQLNGFICTEDIEIIQRSTTKTDQVRKILELVQSKGEECCAYFIHILHEAYDAYIDLRPWFRDIQYTPLDDISVIPVINTDPISKYCEKLRHELRRDTQFIMSYSKSDETPLEDLYTDTQMELLNDRDESLGYLQCLDELLGDQGVFNQQAETIFITGDAGVGKSIVLQKLQNLWSRRELSTRAKFFFKFRCRMFSAFKESYEISLKDLIFKHNCYPDADPDNEVFNYILRFPEMVLFTFDGYDEIQMDFDLDCAPEVVSPEEKTSPLLLLMNLLCGKLLKGSRKILTARTGTEVQSRVLRKKVCLRGFSPEHLKRYTALHFSEQVFRTLVNEQLDANPHLSSLCSIPLFSWIILKSFKHLRSVYDDFELPDSCITLTNVFLLLSEVFLGHSTAPTGLLKRSTRCPAETFKAGEQKLSAFSKLALQCLEKGGFVFSMDEVLSCGLDEKDLQFGFLRPVCHYDICGGSATFEFLHMTLQAFLAAFSLVLDSKNPPNMILRFFSKCEYKTSSSCLPCLGKSKPRDKDPFQTNEHFQFTNLFLCGLLSKPNAALLEHLVPPLLLKQKCKTLKSYLSNVVRTHLKSLPSSQATDIEGIKVHAMPNFLWMLRCIFETNSEEVAKMTANGISADYIKIAFCNIYSADCSALNFVLHHRKKHLGVDMDNNNINDYGVKQLRPSFSKMTVIRLCVNQLTDSSIEVLAEELIRHKVVRVLGLYKNHITDVGAKLVAKIIEECPRLRTVKLGCNQITTVGGKHLACAIQKSKSIFDVGMWGNSIADEGADAFAEALKNHPSLTNLSLSANGVTSHGGRSLAKALKENASLKIFWLIQNRIGDDAASDLADAVRSNSSLTHVMLIENELTVHGAKQLAEALTINTTLKEINIKGNRICEEEEKLFEVEKRLRFR